MLGRVHLRRDPFEGTAAYRRRLRHVIEGSLAVALAIVACGLTAAIWIRTLEPWFDRLGLG